MMAHVAIPPLERMDRQALAAQQAAHLTDLLHAIYGHNAFYTRKLDEAATKRPAIDQMPHSLRYLEKLSW
jgi:phenylacetate-coenzyme A ligase PaaK-like adenylate-forming protein